MSDEARTPDTRRRPRRGLRITLVSALALVIVLAIAIGPRIFGDAVERDGVAAFYAQPAGAASGHPGTIVRSEPLEGHPLDAKAWRIMYRTTDLNGQPVVATGIVVTPNGTAPAEGRTVLAWGHPTTGVADQCAPSRGFDPFIDIEGLRMMLDRGYTVVATDYVGMGTEGPDSYLIGVTAGHSVLDSVRAAQALDGAEAGTSVVLWGHSQGGQAALFAAELAPKYAAELRVQAVAVAAPAADLSALIQNHLDDVSGATIGSYAFQAYAEIYRNRGARLDQVLTPEARQILDEMNRLCLLTNLSELHTIAKPVVGDFFAVDPTQREPWTTLLRENSAGGSPIHAPLFVAQGMADQLVVPRDTEAFVQHEKRLGVEVTFETIEIADHATVAYLALPALSRWLDNLGV